MRLLRAARHIAWIDDESTQTVYVAPVPDGPPVVLRGSSALIWRAISRGESDLVESVADEVGLDADTIRFDVEEFVADLRSRGWVQ